MHEINQNFETLLDYRNDGDFSFDGERIRSIEMFLVILIYE